MFIEQLPLGVTLQLYLLTNEKNGLAGSAVFTSSKKWLHPLFELEEFLTAHTSATKDDERIFEFDKGWKVAASDLFLRDRIIGSAAAFLILRLGLRRVEADLISRRALRLLQDHGVVVTALEIVAAISCATEKIISDQSSPQEVYAFLSERR